MAHRPRRRGALAAAAAGFLDLLAVPPGTRAFRTALVHMSLNLAVTLAYAAAFGWRLGNVTGPVDPPRIALSAVSLAALAASGFLGGKLAYRYGVRVADEKTQAEGFTTTAPGTPPTKERPHDHRRTSHLAHHRPGRLLHARHLDRPRRRPRRNVPPPVPVIFGHFFPAAAYLVIWIIYLLADTKALAWTAFALLLPVALLGFAMFFRWLAVTRTPSVRTAAAPGSAQAATAPEAAFPIPIVLGHGLFAVATLILVLLSALQA